MTEKNEPADEHQRRGTDGGNAQRIIVVGASAGGFEAIKKFVAGLPADFGASIFIVWHMSPNIHGILPQALNRVNTIVATHGHNLEEIKPNRIYVAPPDHHLLVEEGRMLVTRGPKENRFRPAVDPLFRSAAYAYGARVIGVILSGALGDGTAGLWTVKHYGGTTIVQDPLDAEVPSMPESAIREVSIDHCVGIAELPDLLVRLSTDPTTEKAVDMKDEQTKKEIEVAAEEPALEKNIMAFGELSPYACPECHGVLSRLQNDNIIRYRCHTGHAYSADALMASIMEKIEDSLYGAIRGMDESIMLLNYMGDHFAEGNHPKLAALYFKKANDAMERSKLVRKAALVHEQFNNDSLREEAEGRKPG